MGTIPKLHTTRLDHNQTESGVLDVYYHVSEIPKVIGTGLTSRLLPYYLTLLSKEAIRRYGWPYTGHGTVIQ